MDLYIENDEILSNDYAYSQLDYLYYNTIIYNPLIDPNPDPDEKNYFYNYGAER